MPRARGMEMTMRTIIILILLIVTVLALLWLFRSKFLVLTGAYGHTYDEVNASLKKVVCGALDYGCP